MASLETRVASAVTRLDSLETRMASLETRVASAVTRPFSASVMLVLVASTLAVRVALMSPMDESMAVLTSLSMSV